MKMYVTLGIMLFLVYGSTFAHSNDSQILDKEITVNIREASFEQMLTELSAIANVKFAYSVDQLRIEERVSLQAEKRTLRDILEELLTPRNIKYKVHEGDAIISLKRVVEKIERKQSFWVEDEKDIHKERTMIQVTGVVTDVKNQPLPGVNIVVRGSVNGTSSDAEGKYTINVEEKDVLVFSFIGYASQEIVVGKQTAINVILGEDIQSLNEVVVNAGYWQVKAQERTGNISRIDAKVINKQTVNNPLQAMQGRMTGVYIQQNTGMPGGGFSIQIRGQNSLRNGIGGTVNGNLPLYIIDGVPFTSSPLTSPSITSGNLQGGNPLSTINPNDIESIEVLKDADATAIYGSRGANGVVLITTKRANPGKTNIAINIDQGIGQVSNKMELLNTNQYVTMRKEAIANDGFAELLDDPTFDIYWPDLKIWDTTRYTNWQKELIGGTANITNAQISVSGGGEKTQFLLGGSYYRETTVFPGENAFQRGTGNMNVNHESADGKLKIFASTLFSKSLSNIPAGDFTSQAMTLSPNAPALYNENGGLNWEQGTWTNPLVGLERKYTSTIENLVSNITVNYEILSGLSIKSNLGFTNMKVEELSINPLSAYNPEDLAGRTGSSSVGDNRMNTWVIEPQVEYNRNFGKGTFTALVGTTFQQTLQSGSSLQATGYTNDALLENIDAATAINITGFIDTQYRYGALFARINYNWDGKYMINLTGRRDGSSRFGADNQFANFGAVGAAWIFSEERFIRDLAPFLSFGKWRTSYGSTGNDAIGNYQYLDTYSPTNYPYNGSTGLVLTRLANPDYSWETNTKFESAIELGFFKNKLLTSVAFYLNNATGQLVGYPLPVMTGQSSVQFNLPATVQNKGLEIEVNATPIRKNNFSWSINTNISIPSNKLVEFPDIEDFPAYNNRFIVGESIFMAKVFQYERVDPATGLYTFLDVNEDGAITSPNDLVGNKIVGQKFFGGIGNTVKYRNIELDFFFQFVDQMGYNYNRSFTIPGEMSNQPAVVMNRWQQIGDMTDIQRFSFVDPDASVSTAFSRNLFSDHSIEDASFIRLKSVSLSWLFPASWMGRLKMQSGRVFIQGQNLLTFTKYLGLDPETQNSLSLPPLRMITAGFQIKF